MKPPIIAIEGESLSTIDSQLGIIRNSLIRMGIRPAIFRFPNHNNASSIFIDNYNKGDYGNDINPYAVATFYALDRFNSQKDIQYALSDNDVIIVANYMGYSMVKGGIQFSDLSQRKAFYVWLDSFETQLYGNIRPDQGLVIGTSSDSEQDKAYKQLCEDLPKDYRYIRLNSDDDPRVVDAILELMPSKPQQAQTKQKEQQSKKSTASLLDILRSQKTITDIRIQKNSVEISGLNKNQQEIYKEGLETLNKIRNKILKEIDPEERNNISDFLSLLSSVASYKGNSVGSTVTKYGQFEEELNDYVSLQYSSGIRTGAELIDVYPKNQLTIINDILFAVTDLSAEQIQEQTNKMPYEAKHKLIKSYISEGHKTGLNNLSYTFNLGTSLQNILWLKKTIQKEVVTIQDPSPRNGYVIPSSATKQENLFEDYFDILIDLNSRLSNTPASRYLVALGNIASVRVKITYHDINTLLSLKDLPKIASDIILQAKVTHPIIFD